MRVRIYMRTTKGCEERHIDLTPAYRLKPALANIATDGSFTVTVKEFCLTADVLRKLECLDEEGIGI